MSEKFFPPDAAILDEQTILLTKFFVTLFEEHKDNKEFREISKMFNNTLMYDNLELRPKKLKECTDALMVYIELHKINKPELFIKISLFDTKDAIENLTVKTKDEVEADKKVVSALREKYLKRVADEAYKQTKENENKPESEDKQEENQDISTEKPEKLEDKSEDKPEDISTDKPTENQDNSEIKSEDKPEDKPKEEVETVNIDDFLTIETEKPEIDNSIIIETEEQGHK